MFYVSLGMMHIIAVAGKPVSIADVAAADKIVCIPGAEEGNGVLCIPHSTDKPITPISKPMMTSGSPYFGIITSESSMSTVTAVRTTISGKRSTMTGERTTSITEDPSTVAPSSSDSSLQCQGHEAH